jgi:hypothetical protein
MHYVFELQGTRTIYNGTIFEKEGYFGKQIFKGTFEECINFLKNEE